MATTTKQGITVEYGGGVGDSTATILATTNEGIDKEVTFDFAGNTTLQTLTVTQMGLREVFSYADGGELPIYVLKK